MNLKYYLNRKADFYNKQSFIQSDPVLIPHQYTRKEDIEISAFLTAIISWGRRGEIIKRAKVLMNLMDNSPFDFINNACKKEIRNLNSFYYRTYNSDDLLFMIYALRNIYQNNGGLENIANTSYRQTENMKIVIGSIRNAMLKTPHLQRSEKHLANPETGSAAKRINMFLRWMVRSDD